MTEEKDKRQKAIGGIVSKVMQAALQAGELDSTFRAMFTPQTPAAADDIKIPLGTFKKSEFPGIFKDDVNVSADEFKPTREVWHVYMDVTQSMPLLRVVRITENKDSGHKWLDEDNITLDPQETYETEAEGLAALQTALVEHMRKIAIALQITNKHIEKNKKAGK